MKTLGKILGSKKGVQEIFKMANKAVGSLDDDVFSKEEKTQQLFEILKAYEPFKLIQRYLALAFTFVFLFAFLVAFITFSAGVWFNFQDWMDAAYKQLEMITDVLGKPVLAIALLYFGGGTINSIFEGKKKKKINEKS